MSYEMILIKSEFPADAVYFISNVDVVAAELTVQNHKSSTPELLDCKEEKKKYMCPVCSHSFLRRGSLYKHVRAVHQTSLSAVKKNGTVRCQETDCDEYFQTIEKLRQHLEDKHNMSLVTESMTFDNYNEFIRWKSQMELRTKSSFYKVVGNIRIKRGHVEKYWCNRSGFYTSTKPKGMKRRPVCKIGIHCTATIKVRVAKWGAVVVDHCSTHYKHGPELELLPIPTHVLTDIATDLQNGMEVGKILDSRRTITENEEINRSHLITRKDIYNVERRLLRSSERLKSKYQSVYPTAEAKSTECKIAGTVLCDTQPLERPLDILEQDSSKRTEEILQGTEKRDGETVEMNRELMKPLERPLDNREQDSSKRTEEILQAVGYRDRETVEMKRELIEMMLSNVKARIVGCSDSKTLDNVARSLATNLYELHCPSSIGARASYVQECTAETIEHLPHKKSKTTKITTSDQLPENTQESNGLVHDAESYSDHTYI